MKYEMQIPTEKHNLRTTDRPGHQRMATRQLREDIKAGTPRTSTTLPYRGAKGTKFANTQHRETGVVYDMRAGPDFTPHMKYEMQIPFVEF